MEVVLTSNEIIKPSSPTPQHLKTFKLSLLDLFIPPGYVPLVFFYPSNCEHPPTKRRLLNLKDSLSKALTRLYPLAGRIKNRSSVDCNDAGALFIEAQVNIEMHEFLEQPNLQLISSFLPISESTGMEPIESLPQVAIKANIFSCGGIAIGICVLHTIIDAYTTKVLLGEWASIVRGDHIKGDNEEQLETLYAHNKAASLFPVKENLLPELYSWSEFASLKESNVVRRRFVFSGEAISTLKAKARSEQVPHPTRTEAVAGIIWKCAMNASRVLSSGLQKPTVMTSAVHLRPRLKSPLPDYSIGNLVWTSLALYDPSEMETHSHQAGNELACLVELLRKSVSQVDSDFVQKLQGEQGHLKVVKIVEEMGEMISRVGGEPVWFLGSSVIKLGWYDVDFGWGKPIWVSLAGNGDHEAQFRFLVLMETPVGDGIEAWLSLDEREMAIMEQDLEFLTYVTVNPGVVF